MITLYGIYKSSKWLWILLVWSNQMIKLLILFSLKGKGGKALNSIDRNNYRRKEKGLKDRGKGIWKWLMVFYLGKRRLCGCLS
jgi:hypothetical protein